jgi:hypothetical protein
MSVKDLLAQACARLAATKLTREEMRLAGYPDSMPEIDPSPDDVGERPARAGLRAPGGDETDARLCDNALGVRGREPEAHQHGLPTSFVK